MKRFITMLVAGGIAWWAWWYTFTVDPGGEGFGFETCSDGEGLCTDDPSVLTLGLSLVAGLVAFFALWSWVRLVKRKLRGTDAETEARREAAAAWASTPATTTGWIEQVTSSVQQGLQAAQQGYAASYGAAGILGSAPQASASPVPGDPTMVGQAGIIGDPTAAAPAAGPAVAGTAAAPTGGASATTAGAAAAVPPAGRAPTSADRAASRDRWLRRASGAGPGGREATASSTSLTGVPAYDPTPTRATSGQVPSAPPPSTGTTASASASDALAAATPTSASVVLVSVGDRELGVQREVRRLGGTGLEEAKRLLAAVAREPQVIAQDLPWKQAQDVKRTLERMGAKVDLV